MEECRHMPIKPVIPCGQAFLESLPPGYRFKPRDHELVVHYLKRRVYNLPLQPNIIKEVNLYDYNPETLTQEYNDDQKRVTEWYFFTPRNRKYPNGSRPQRAAGKGYWKATGADKPVEFQGNIVGFKKTLVYYTGKAKDDKTNWIMHEFVLSDPPARERAGNDDMRLDDWVLCRVYKKQKDIKPVTPQQCTDQKQEKEDSIPYATPAAHTEIQTQECGNSRKRDGNDDMLLDDCEFCRVYKKQKDTEVVTTRQGTHQKEEAEDSIPDAIPALTEIQQQQYGNIQHQTEQFQVGGFNRPPQQNFAMPLYNAVDDSTFGLPKLPGSLHAQQVVFGYPVAASIPPPAGQEHLDTIHQQQQQLSGLLNDIQFSLDDQHLLDMDFGVPFDWKEGN